VAGRFTAVGLEAVIRGLGGFTTGMQTMRRQMGLTGAATLRATKQSKGLSSAMTRFGQSVRNAGNQLLILGFQMTFLASGAFASVIAKAAEFEKSMVKINTLSGVSLETIRGWTDELLDLGPALGKTPTELADALFFITSSAFTGSKALDVLEASAKASSIGLGETKVVADVVTSAMKAFTRQNLTAAQATDILVAAVDKGKFEAEELAPSLGRVFGVASQLKISFEEVAAFIATYTRVGVPASVATTSLRSAMNALLLPTAQANEVFASINTTGEEVRAMIADPNIGLAQVIIALSAALSEDDEAFGRVIGSARGFAGVAVNTGPLLKDYVEILESIENSAGKTERAFTTFKQTTTFAFNSAKASLESLAITIGGILLPGINRLLIGLGSFLKVIREFTAEHPKLTLVVGALAGIVTITGPLLIVVGLLISAFGTLITAIGALAGALSFLLTLPGLLLAAFLALAGGIATSVAVSMDNARDKLDEKGESLARRAFEWGKALILSFARGMGAVAGAVVGVLIAIGNAIADQLRSHSPPNLLPDLEEWGLAAMNSWLDGWLRADFSIFDQVSDIVETWIRSIGQNIAEEDLIPTIIGSRADIAEIVDEISRTGDITNETLSKLFENIGAVNPELAEYIKSLGDLANANRAVEVAQNALNEAQERYENILKPINDELDALQARRQEIIDQQRIEELQSFLADPDLPGLGRELAFMELRDIELQKQKRSVEGQRDAELDLLGDRLSSAQMEANLAEQRVNHLKSIVDIQIENNDLIREQIELLERLQEAQDNNSESVGELVENIGDLGDALTGIQGLFSGEGEGGMFAKKPKNGGGIFDFDIDVDAIIEEINTLIDEVVTAFEEGFGSPEKIQELQDVWSDVIILTIQVADTEGVIAVAKDWIAGILIGSINGATDEVAAKINFGDILLSIFFGKESDESFGEFIKRNVTEWFSSLGEAIGNVVDLLFNDREAGSQSLLETLKNFPGGIGTVTKIITGLWDIIVQVDEAAGNFVETLFNLKEWLYGTGEQADKAADFIGPRPGAGGGGLGLAMSGTASKTTLLKWALIGMANKITGPVRTAISNLHSFLTDKLIPTIGTKWHDAVGNVREKFENLREKIDVGFHNAITWLEEFLGVDFSETLESVRDLLGFDEETGLGGVLGKLQTKWEEFKTFLSGALTTAFNEFTEHVLNPLHESVNNVAEAIKNAISRAIELLNLLPFLDIPDPFHESVSPFVRAFTHASEAMEYMAQESVPMLSSALQGNLGNALAPMVAGAGAGITSVQPVHAGTTITNTRSANINMGGQVINNGMDEALFIARVKRAMREAI